MARRPDPAEFDTPLTQKDLAKRRGTSRCFPRAAYQEAYDRCRLEGDALPRDSAIPELVTVWKLL